MCPSNVGARLLFLAGVTLTRNAGSGFVVSKVESFMCFCTTAQVFRQQSMKYDRKSCATFQCRESAGRGERGPVKSTSVEHSAVQVWSYDCCKSNTREWFSVCLLEHSFVRSLALLWMCNIALAIKWWRWSGSYDDTKWARRCWLVGWLSG